jgi:ABC-type transporter Mla subunit MlaD
MRIYGPADVLGLAGQFRTGLAEGADQAKELFDLVPRLLGLVERAELLLDSAERTLARTAEVVEAAHATRERVDDVSAEAMKLLETTKSLSDRGEALLSDAEAIVPSALPVLGQVIEAIDPAEVRAVNQLVNRLPAMVDRIDTIGPDVHLILESVTDLSQAIKGFPGMAALIRRGERKDDQRAIDDMAGEAVGSPD